MAPLKLTFIADTHHYSQKLGVTGRQFELRSGSDQKCLAETGAIIDSAFEKIANSDTDFVLIAGDITNDGEVLSHIEFKQKLDKLAMKKKVYLITATHDWCCDKNPRRFADNFVYHDVQTMAPDTLYDFYQDYTTRDAIAVFETHLGTKSYVIQLNDNVRLLALNDDQNGSGAAGFSPEHFDWIDEQIKKANDDGCLMIGMEHHLLIPHLNPLITGGGTCVGDREVVASRLADDGLKYMFVGHSHIQRTDHFVSPAGNKITEVNIGSLVGYPAPMVNVVVNDDMTLSYNVEHLEEFEYNGEKIDAQTYLAKHFTAMLSNVLMCENKFEFQDRMTALQADGESLSRFFFLLKPLLSFVRDDNVAEVARKLRNIGLGRMIEKEWVDEYGTCKITDFIYQIMLSAMDGSKKIYDRESSYYKLVMAIVSIPSRFFKSNTNLKKFIMTVDTILAGGMYNNQNETI